MCGSLNQTTVQTKKSVKLSFYGNWTKFKTNNWNQCKRSIWFKHAHKKKSQQYHKKKIEDKNKKCSPLSENTHTKIKNEPVRWPLYSNYRRQQCIETTFRSGYSKSVEKIFGLSSWIKKSTCVYNLNNSTRNVYEIGCKKYCYCWSVIA